MRTSYGRRITIIIVNELESIGMGGRSGERTSEAEVESRSDKKSIKNAGNVKANSGLIELSSPAFSSSPEHFFAFHEARHWISLVSGEIDGACAWVTTYSTLVGEFRAESVLLGAIGPIGAVQTCSKCFQGWKRATNMKDFCVKRVRPCQPFISFELLRAVVLDYFGSLRDFFRSESQIRLFSRYFYTFVIKFTDARRVKEIFKSRVIINSRNTENLTLPRVESIRSRSGKFPAVLISHSNRAQI